MGSPAAALDGLSAEPGGPSGLQHRASGHPGRAQPDGHFRRSYRNDFQPVLRPDGTDRRMGRRPLLPQMGDDNQHPVLERRDDVHGPCDQHVLADCPALRGDRRRRGLLRARELFAARPVPYRHARQGHVHPPDRLLCRRDPRRLLLPRETPRRQPAPAKAPLTASSGHRRQHPLPRQRLLPPGIVLPEAVAFPGR